MSIVYVNNIADALLIKRPILLAKFSKLKKYGLEKAKNSNGYNACDIIMAIDTRLSMNYGNQMGKDINKQLEYVKKYLLTNGEI